MSIALRSMSKEDREAAINRRLRNSNKDKSGKIVGGLGYWGARDSEQASRK